MNVHTSITAEMQVWFTAQEMADAAEAGLFVGIPTTKRKINEKAERENWSRYHALVKAEKGRGGTITRYHIDLLPLDVRVLYLKRFIRATPDDLRVSGALEANLTERAREERAARMVVVRLADRFKRLNRMTVMASDHMFVMAFNGGEVDGLPDWVGKTIGKLSVRTLQRWRSAARDNDGLALAHDPADARKGTGVLEIANEGRVRTHILAWIADAPALSAEIVRNMVVFEFGETLVGRHGELKAVPPTRTFQHYIAQLREEEKAIILAHSDPDAYRSRMKLRGKGAYRFVTRPNQMWMIDASPVDALCTDGRWSMYACVDVATRRYIITFSKTARAEAVALLIRKAIIEWGKPEVIKTDNGSDFVAISTKRLFDDLDIAPDTSHAYSPAEKGIVERAIKTFQHEVAPQLKGYIGHNVAERKAIENKRSFAQRLGTDERDLFGVEMTIDELRAYTEEWLTYIYNERKHGGLKDISPNTAAANSSEHIRRVDERALDALLMPVAGKDGIRVYGPRGIQIDHRFYLSGTIMVGTDLFCRHHPDDMGQIYVYSADGRQFLDVAVCPEFSGVNPAEFAKAKIAQHGAMVAERMKDMKAEIRRINKGPAAIARSIDVAKRHKAERDAASANVIQLPKREEQHVTPAILAALESVSTPEPVAMSQTVSDLHNQILADLAPQAPGGNVTPIRTTATPEQKFRRWLDFAKRIEAGETVSTEDAYWAGNYETSAEFKAQKTLYDDFGDQAPALRT